jgi:hypothetical protein
MRPKTQMLSVSLSLVLPLTAALIGGCMQPAATADDEMDSDTLLVDNGLRAINGVKAYNGLASIENGVNTAAGLKTSAGLSSTVGLMTTVDGRTTAAYLVRCALPAGKVLSKADQTGKLYALAGGVGVAPEWETGSCGATCQRWVSACMLALINTTGDHYPVWMVAQSPGVGWGVDPGYPFQEGAFFGNIFTSPPSAYYCGGRDLGITPIPGRIGSVQGPVPYSNIYGTKGYCSKSCTPADYPHASDGWKACSGWNEVINVWHQ